MGRELRRRLRHRHPGERQGLPGAVQVHRQAQQDHADHRPAEADARGHQEARSGDAEQQGERVVQYMLKRVSGEEWALRASELHGHCLGPFAPRQKGYISKIRKGATHEKT